MPSSAHITVHGKDLHIVAPTLYQLIGVLRYLASWRLFQKRMGNSIGDYVLDVGANLGSYAMMISFGFPDAKVLCIEPSSYNYQFLLRNTKDFPNIECRQMAASDNRGTLVIGMPPDSDPANNTGWITAHGYGESFREEVQTIPLDEIREGVTFLKIDVEGHEMHVLKGMTKMLQEQRPNVFIELIDKNLRRSNTSTRKVSAFMARYQYGLSSYDERNGLFTPAEKWLV